MFEKHKIKKQGKMILRDMQAQQFAQQQMKAAQPPSPDSGQGKTASEFERMSNYVNKARSVVLRRLGDP